MGLIQTLVCLNIDIWGAFVCVKKKKINKVTFLILAVPSKCAN